MTAWFSRIADVTAIKKLLSAPFLLRRSQNIGQCWHASSLCISRSFSVFLRTRCRYLHPTYHRVPGPQFLSMLSRGLASQTNSKCMERFHPTLATLGITQMYLSLLTTNPVILRSPIPLGATQATSGGAGAQLRCRKPAPIDHCQWQQTHWVLDHSWNSAKRRSKHILWPLPFPAPATSIEAKHATLVLCSYAVEGMWSQSLHCPMLFSVHLFTNLATPHTYMSNSKTRPLSLFCLFCYCYPIRGTSQAWHPTMNVSQNLNALESVVHDVYIVRVSPQILTDLADSLFKRPKVHSRYKNSPL